MTYTAVVITVSDRVSEGVAEDRTGPAVVKLLNSSDGWSLKETRVVPDEISAIQGCVISYTDKADLLIFAGGTGLAARDVTPEAIEPLLSKTAPGITTSIIIFSLQKTPLAALGRPICGVRSKTMILAVPGSVKGAVESVEAVLGTMGHAIEIIRGGKDAHAGPAFKSIRGEGETGQTDKHHHHGGHQCVHHERHEEGRSRDDFGLHSSVASRPRTSPYPLLSYDTAVKTILEATPILEPMDRPVDETLVGYCLATDVYAEIDVPGFRASVLDGYAVHSGDGPGIYPIHTVSNAGSHLPPSLPAKTIARITTGAALPPNADAIVMVEDTKLVQASPEGEELQVEILKKVQPGEAVRDVGTDVRKGDLVLKKYDMLLGAEIGLLCSVGISTVRVFKRPKVGVLSTGHEVVSTATPLASDEQKIHDTNRPALLATLRMLGYETFDHGILPDDPDRVEAFFREWKESDQDALITTGGVSMGEKDYVKTVLNELGTIHVGRIKVKPGKPTTFATLRDHQQREKVVFALPGNPLSAMSMFYVFALPSLKKLSGDNAHHNWLTATLETAIRADPHRLEFHPAHVTGRSSEGKIIASARILREGPSSRIMRMAGANGLVAVKPGTGTVDKGTTVEVLMVGMLDTRYR
ncbi:hypothetical protein BC832DRAFT_388582 [Gaertneriomyces semiglobifer]|nr:hypothetical protein BC832DRAFT_388582 [Gaertneriomyces semiglobifer]